MKTNALPDAPTLELPYWIADVFTDRALSGNPLAVFPDAPELSDARMQAIARELNLSETVFVRPARNAMHSCALRIFTPGTELPFAGHPTVGTALVLATLDKLPNSVRSGATLSLIFEEGVGPIPVTVRLDGQRPVFAQFTAARVPELAPAATPAQLAAMLSLDAADIGATLDGRELTPAVASCGVPFTCVPLRSLDALARARLNVAAVSAHQQFYLYVPTGDVDFRARMFANDFGIAEDPATGSAAAALTGVLAAHELRTTGTLQWRITQGVEMGRPSLIEIEADKLAGKVTATRVGGSAVIVGRGQLALPD